MLTLCDSSGDQEQAQSGRGSRPMRKAEPEEAARRECEKPKTKTKKIRIPKAKAAENETLYTLFSLPVTRYWKYSALG